jgi:hypothetical protein
MKFEECKLVSPWISLQIKEANIIYCRLSKLTYIVKFSVSGRSILGEILVCAKVFYPKALCSELDV